MTESGRRLEDLIDLLGILEATNNKRESDAIDTLLVDGLVRVDTMNRVLGLIRSVLAVAVSV